MTRRAVDDSVYSVFVQEMRAAFAERERATTTEQKLAIEQKVEGIMRKHLCASHLYAAAEGFEQAAVRVPRDTTPDPGCQSGRVDDRQVRPQAADGAALVERKVAAAGRDAE